MNINFHSPTGGAGCSTIAVATALQLRDADTVALIETRNDCRRILGVASDSAIADYEQSLELHLSRGTSSRQLNAYVDGQRMHHAHTVADWGTTAPLGEGTNVVVVKNTYLSLSRYRTQRENGYDEDFAIAVFDDRLSLSLNDVSTVLGRSADAIVPIDLSISRCVDAGTISHRTPQSLATPIANLITTIGTTT